MNQNITFLFVTITWINALILTKHIDALIDTKFQLLNTYKLLFTEQIDALIDTQFTYALIDVVLTSDCNYISSYWCTITQMTSMYLSVPYCNMHTDVVLENTISSIGQHS